MTLLEQISQQYEQAKRELFEYERLFVAGRPRTERHAVLSEACRCWGHALHLAQSQRGNFVG